MEDVQAYILPKKSVVPGEYGYYINQVENLFKHPFQVPLEEYGLPLQVTDKLVGILRQADTIDDALNRIRILRPADLGLDPFEQKLLEDCMLYL